MAGSSLMAARPLGFLATCQFGGRGTAAHNHPATRHANVNGITLSSWNRCFGTMAQYRFHDACFEPNWAAFWYNK